MSKTSTNSMVRETYYWYECFYNNENIFNYSKNLINNYFKKNDKI